MIKKIKRKMYFHYSTAKKASKSKWDFILIVIDLLYCKMRFHITNNEYLQYMFYNFKNRYRKNFILIYHQAYKYRNMITRKNTWSKYNFYKRMPELYLREIIYAPECGEEKFLAFVRKHNKFVVKPDIGSLGKDIKVAECENDDKARALFATFSFENPVLCEEYICQHELLQQLNPFSVNTIRVVSIIKDNKVEIISATLRTGAVANSVVDNLHNGGIGAQIDIETGIVITYGKDYKFNSYAHHPISGSQFIGMNIPYWDKVIELVEKAHSKVANWIIFGWDIAITQTGVDLVEANSAPGPRLMQTMDCIPKGKDFLPLLKKDIIKKDYWS